MNFDLNALDERCFAIATEKLPESQKSFVRSKWSTLRAIAAQNAGLKKWSRHLLKHPEIEAAFRSLIAGIEMEGVKFWNETRGDSHLEAVLRLFFDDNSKLGDVQFSLEEKLAFFWKYNPSIVQQLRIRAEQIFRDLYERQVWNYHDTQVIQMLIGHLIALYPFFDPPQGTEIDLLQMIEGTWSLVKFKSTTIPLVKRKILAYGLTPVNHPKARPILLFCGTPYPASRGFWHGIKSDIDPFYWVGWELFKKGKPRIDDWMQKHEEVDCFGVSLGGALGYYAGIEYGKRIKVYAFGPPGLFPKTQKTDQIYGEAYFHIRDYVPSVGYHPEGPNFKTYVVLTEADRNFILAHTRPGGCNPTLIVRLDPKYENRRIIRHCRTLLKEFLSTLIFMVVAPFWLLVKGILWVRKSLRINAKL